MDVQKRWPLVLREKRADEFPLDLLLPVYKLYYHSRCFFANWVCQMQYPPQTHCWIWAKKMNSMWTICKTFWESVQMGERGRVVSCQFYTGSWMYMCVCVCVLPVEDCWACMEAWWKRETWSHSLDRLYTGSVFQLSPLLNIHMHINDYKDNVKWQGQCTTLKIWYKNDHLTPKSKWMCARTRVCVCVCVYILSSKVMLENRNIRFYSKVHAAQVLLPLEQKGDNPYQIMKLFNCIMLIQLFT